MNSFFINKIKRTIPIGTIKKFRDLLRKWVMSALIGKQYLDQYNNKNIDESQDYCLIKFGCEEVVRINEPDYLADIPSWIKQMMGSYTIPRPYIFELRNAQLFGPCANGFTSSGSLIRETTIPIFLPLEAGVNTRALFIKKFLKIGTFEFNTACSLVNVWSHNYYHWIVDCLSRLELIEYYQQKTGIQPKLIIPSNSSSWQKESLKLLGYELENCVYWNTSRMHIEKLLAPSFRMGSTFIVSPKACHWLRQRIINNLSNTISPEHSFSPRVLISRRQASRRRVINEDELIEALTSFGFISYTLEEMSFADQVRLFSQAEIVIGPHGAGLINMIFSQELTVIELLRKPINPIFFCLSKSLNFKYCFIDCTSKTAQTEINPKNNDMIVDINKLQNLVSRALNEK